MKEKKQKDHLAQLVEEQNINLLLIAEHLIEMDNLLTKMPSRPSTINKKVSIIQFLKKFFNRTVH